MDYKKHKNHKRLQDKNHRIQNTKTTKNNLSNRQDKKSITIQSHGEKAYKLLALQYNISTNKAKGLIDCGRVSVNGRRLIIAREMLPVNTKFEVLDTLSHIVFEDEDILVLDKSCGIDSYSLLEMHPNCKLINRLDKDTSGVILLAKNEKMRKIAMQEFKQQRVEKAYYALIEGKLYEEINIEKKIITQKDSKAKSLIDKNGLDAISRVTPLQIFDKTTLVSVQILTGRTHQIRIHLASIKHPIVGDIIYNKVSQIKSKRLMLHCYKTALLNYTFQSDVNIHDTFDIH